MNSLVEASQVCSYEETGYINTIYNWLNQGIGLIEHERKFVNGKYVSEPPKYYQTYGDQKWNGGYNFAEVNANSQGYDGLLYLR